MSNFHMTLFGKDFEKYNLFCFCPVSLVIFRRLEIIVKVFYSILVNGITKYLAYLKVVQNQNKTKIVSFISSGRRAAENRKLYKIRTDFTP